MEISGQIIKILEPVTGESQNGPWKKNEFVIETADKYPKKICFAAWNELADEIAKLEEGASIKVHFDVQSREYNDKWYTDAKAWKIIESGNAEQQLDNNNADAVNLPDANEDDDLPF